MKIINRTEFLKMPPGTIFIEFSETGWPANQAFMIKGETWYFNDRPDAVHDFLETSLSTWAGDCTDDLIVNKLRMEQGESIPTDISSCRNGLFQEDGKYLIYEKADIVKMRDIFTAIIDDTYKPD